MGHPRGSTRQAHRGCLRAYAIGYLPNGLLNQKGDLPFLGGRWVSQRTVSPKHLALSDSCINFHQFLPPQSGFLLVVRKQETRLLGKKLVSQGTRPAWL